MRLVKGEKYILREGDAWIPVTYSHPIDTQRVMVRLDYNGNVIMVNKSRLRYAEDPICETAGV